MTTPQREFEVLGRLDPLVAIFVARVTHTPSPAHCALERHLQTPTTVDELKTIKYETY